MTTQAISKSALLANALADNDAALMALAVLDHPASHVLAQTTQQRLWRMGAGLVEISPKDQAIVRCMAEAVFVEELA